MKGFLTWIVVLGVFGAGAGYLINIHKTEAAQKSYELELATLKRDFQKKAVGLSLLDADAYRNEIGPLLTSYFQKLDELNKKHPGQQDFAREQKRTDEEAAAGRLKDGQKQAREERIKLTSDLFEKMRSGQYRPLYTVADKTFRFDIYDIQAEKVAGEERVKLSYVHWGAFGPVGYNLIEGTIRTAPVDPKTKATDIQVPKIVGEGQPPSLQVEPEKWVMEFIPGVEIGYYDLPKFPQVATAVQLTFDFDLKTAGGSSQMAHLEFPDIPIPDAWKTAAWQAETQTATAEEMRAAGADVPAGK